MVREPTRQEPMRPPWGELRAGERCRHEDFVARPTDDERVARKCHFDDPSAGPLHAPPMEDGGDFEDIRRHLEAVLQGVPKGMWLRI